MIVILEDDGRRAEAMRRQILGIASQSTMVFFENAPDMVDWLQDNLGSVDLLCLDHDLGPNRDRNGEVFDPGVGRDVVDYLATQDPCCPVLIHSSNDPAAQGMHFALKEAGWHNERVVPYDDLAWIEVVWLPAVTRILGYEQQG